MYVCIYLFVCLFHGLSSLLQFKEECGLERSNSGTLQVPEKYVECKYFGNGTLEVCVGNLYGFVHT